MSIYVPDRPPQTTIRGHTVAQPVSQRHGRGWVDTVHFLLGQALPPTLSLNLEPVIAASPVDYVFAHKRTPGARALMVLAELHEPDADGRACRLDLARLSGTTDYLPVGTIEGDMHGNRALFPQTGFYSNPAKFVDFIDLSGWTVGALEWVRVRWTDGHSAYPAGGTHGISRLHAFEVPRATIAEDSNDAGVDGGWPFVGNYLWDGDATLTLDGFKRLAAEIDRARTQLRAHHQILTPESIADSWACGSSVGVWAPVVFGPGTTQTRFVTRARRLWEASTPNQQKLVARYTTQHATDGAELRVTATSRVTGTVIQSTLALPASLGFAASAEVAAPIPCDGDGQMVELTFDYKTTGAANLRLSCLDLIEDEV